MKEDGAYKFFNETQNYLHRNFGVRIRAEIVQRLIDPQDVDLLDIGCGDGGVSIQFIDKNRIVFLDLSDRMLMLVEKRIPVPYFNRAKMVNGSISNFYPENRFDVVLAIGLLAHLPSIDDFFKHIREHIIKRNGILILQFSDNGSWITRLNHLLAKRYSYKLNRISPSLLLSMAKSNGFALNEEIRFGLQLPGMGYLPDGLLYRYAKFIMWSGIGHYLGSEVIWKMEAMNG